NSRAKFPGSRTVDRAARGGLPPHSSHNRGTRLRVWVSVGVRAPVTAVGAVGRRRGRGVSHAASNGRRPGWREPRADKSRTGGRASGSKGPDGGQGTAVGAQPPADGDSALESGEVAQPATRGFRSGNH